MNRHWGRLLPALAVLAWVGCSTDQLTLGEGTPATIEVRVYVDADGDGAYTTGADDPVVGITITATGDAADLSETTNAEGLATFTSVVPGSYTLAVSGTPPAGAVLASATNPAVAAPFQGGTLSAEFRYAYMPGSLSGRIFRDDNDNGTFEPADDTPAAGLPVALRKAGATDELASTSTDVAGLFTFTGLRPGDYVVDITPFQTITIVGGNSVNATVTADGTTGLDILFTGNLVITVAEARMAAAGEVVTVEAVITWQNQWDARIYFFQDETAGMSAFDVNEPMLQVGDSVRLTGERGAFRGEEQLSPVTSLEILGNVGEPTPRLVTGNEINAGQFQGELVTIEGTLDSLQVSSFDNHMLFFTDGAAVIYTVYVDSRTGVASADWTTGLVYSIVGVLGSDDDNALQYRVEIRQPSDAVPGSSTVDIADARTQGGSTVTVEGVVTWQQSWDERVYFLQDATGGISTFHSGAPTLARGDRVIVTGTVGAFRGEVQLSPVDAISILGNEPVPAPRIVTGADINAGQFQGELVTLSGTVDSVLVSSFDNHMVWLSDAVDTDFTAYVDSRNGVASADWTVGATVTLLGVLGTDDSNMPAARLEIRDAQDIQPAQPALVDIATARTQSGSTVTVEGVVTWQQNWDERVYFLQDATAGISTFHSGAPLLMRGDRVRVTGTVGAFRSEVQISPVNAIGVLGNEPIPAARTVTGADINGGSFQGELVTISGTVDSVQVFSFDNHMVWLSDPTGTDFTAYVDSRNGVASSDWTVSATVTLFGVLGTDDGNTPAARLEIRDAQDIQ